jgi:hypothetical protein
MLGVLYMLGMLVVFVLPSSSSAVASPAAC